MTASLDTELDTLNAIRRKFAQRMSLHLGAFVRDASADLFEANPRDEGNSLLALAGSIIELRNTLLAEEAPIDQVAKDYLLGYLRFTHNASLGSASPSQTRFAATLLEACNEADA